MQRFITRPALLQRLAARPLMATLKTPLITRALSSTPTSFAPSAAASQLASSLEKELKYETENAAPKDPAVESFLGNGVWSVSHDPIKISDLCVDLYI